MPPLIAPTYANIRYADRSPAEVLDLYLPPHGEAAPVVLFIHGGAFRFGAKGPPSPGLAADIQAMNDRGIALASMNYRLSAEAPFPAALVDVKAAIRFLRARARAWHLDPARIALWGKSAGANLALMAGLTPSNPELADKTLGNPNEPEDVAAIVAFYPPTDFTTIDAQWKNTNCGTHAVNRDAGDKLEALYLGDPDQARRASPIAYAHAPAPLIMLQAGTADCLVPPEQSRELYRALPAATTELELVQGARHADPLFDAPVNLAGVGNFFQHAFK